MNPSKEIEKCRKEILRDYRRGDISESQMEREMRELDKEERLYDGQWDSDDY